MPTKPQTTKEYFTFLTILHGAMLVVQVMFVAVAYYLVSSGQFTTSPDLNDAFKIVAPAVILAGYLGSNFLVRAQLKLVKQKPALKDKLHGYKTGLLIKWALLEGPSVFCVVCFLLTGNYYYLGLAALMIGLFLFNRPTPAGTILDLELISSDKKLIEDPNAVVSEINQVE